MNDIYICRECGAVAVRENELVCPACESLNLVNLSQMTPEQRVRLARMAYVLI